eukprot:m.10937 g.10937  ORF g.10937 m.10937 type:complete len:377 (+) comp6766_c0_seq2:25-1155(+)
MSEREEAKMKATAPQHSGPPPIPSRDGSGVRPSAINNNSNIQGVERVSNTSEEESATTNRNNRRQTNFNNSIDPFSSFGRGYGRYNHGGYPGYGGGYGGYGSYGGMPPGYRGDNQVFQLIQDQGQNTFETVERLVFAVSSVAAMLESSYDALYSSFMAVVSVAGHMDQLKEKLIKIFKGIIRMRSIRRIIAKIIRLIGLTPPRFFAQAEESLPGNEGKFPWPLIVFFALVFGSPYLIYSMLVKKKPEDLRLPVQGRVAWDFSPQKNDELQITKGQIVTVHPPMDEPEGWISAETEDGERGLIPKTYVRLLKQSNDSDQIKALPSAKNRRRNAPAIPQQSTKNLPQGLAQEYSNVFENAQDAVNDEQQPGGHNNVNQ